MRQADLAHHLYKWKSNCGIISYFQKFKLANTYILGQTTGLLREGPTLGGKLRDCIYKKLKGMLSWSCVETLAHSLIKKIQEGYHEHWKMQAQHFYTGNKTANRVYTHTQNTPDLKLLLQTLYIQSCLYSSDWSQLTLNFWLTAISHRRLLLATCFVRTLTDHGNAD